MNVLGEIDKHEHAAVAVDNKLKVLSARRNHGYFEDHVGTKLTDFVCNA